MVVTRHKNTIFGLNNDLQNLTDKDNALNLKIENFNSDLTATTERIESEYKAEIARVDGDISTNNTNSISRDDALSDRLNIVEGDDTVVGSIANSTKTAKDFAQSLVDAVNGDLDVLDQLVQVINGDSSTEGSFRKAITDVVGAAPEALDTLQEIAAALNNDPDLYGTITALISSNIQNAKDELKGQVSDAFDTLEEIEVALNIINGNDTVVGSIAKTLADAKSFATSAVNDEKARAEAVEATKMDKSANLSDVEDKATARTNIDVFSKAEVNEAVRLGGAKGASELVTITNDKITLTNEAKDGMLLNFNCIRYTDENALAWDIPCTLISGKEWQAHPDFSGQFDGKQALVQYFYTPLA